MCLSNRVYSNYLDWSGARKRKKKEGFKLERDAKTFERDFLTKQQSNCDMPFGSLVALYLENSETRVRSTTLANN